MKRNVLILITSLTIVGCGKHASKGEQGQSGKDGQSIVGPQGPQGPQGDAGTITTLVPFCTKKTVYPIVFSEVGMCIDGKLYAVYSQNGGFLSEIPEGTYSSNGINSSCIFTVKQNCEISR